VIGRLAGLVLPDYIYDIYGNLDKLLLLFNTFCLFVVVKLSRERQIKWRLHFYKLFYIAALFYSS